MADPFKVVKPLAISGTVLNSSSVPETDYAAWNSGTTYALNDRVILTSTHKIYQSAQASNTNHNPSDPGSTWWVEVSATNRYKMFDTSNTTATTVSGSMSVVLRPGQVITTVALLGLLGTSARIRVSDPTAGIVYDQTFSLLAVPLITGWWYWLYGNRVAPTQVLVTGLPPYPNADIVIDIAGTTTSCASCIIGQEIDIGLGVEYGARLGIQSYSRKTTDDFGNITVITRPFARTASFDMMLTKEETDSVYNTLSLYRDTVCLWIGSPEYESTVVYGFMKSFDIVIPYPLHSQCSIELEGIT